MNYRSMTKIAYGIIKIFKTYWFKFILWTVVGYWTKPYNEIFELERKTKLKFQIDWPYDSNRRIIIKYLECCRR